MLDRITLTGLEVFAHHGVFDFEARDGQTFRIDVELMVDLSLAATTDQLEHTVDYGDLANRIVANVQSTRHQLIETVAGNIAQLVLKDSRVEQVTVTVHKPSAPIQHSFADVSVAVTRRRAEQGQ